MSDDELEREKNASYRLGHISQLEDIADELRDRAGDLYANTSRTDTKKAKFAKQLANEYDDRADELREQYEEKFK